jgi:hypothetical protein
MVSSGILHRVGLVRTDVSVRIHNVFTNNPARPFYRSLGPHFVLWPFTTQATIPFPLCIHNSEFHSSFLSHLVFLRRVRRLLVRAGLVPSSPILVTLMMELIRSSDTLVLTRATRRNIPEDTILHRTVIIQEAMFQSGQYAGDGTGTVHQELC